MRPYIHTHIKKEILRLSGSTTINPKIKQYHNKVIRVRGTSTIIGFKGLTAS